MMRSERSMRAEFEREWVGWPPRIEWQLFGTATFPRRVSADDADKTFTGFLDSLERAMRGMVACMSVRENRSRGGENEYVGEHFHFVLCGEELIPAELVKTLWCSIVRASRSEENPSMKAEVFQADRGGLEYIVKSCHEHDAALAPSTKLLLFRS